MSMSNSKVSRRSFVQASLGFLLLARKDQAWDFAATAARTTGVDVTLEGRVTGQGNEVVSFGLPLPPGFLSDHREIRVVNASGEEVNAAVRVLALWRTGGREGSIRSVLIQFASDFTHERVQRIRILFQPRRKIVSSFVPVEETLINKNGLEGPRVMALLPADWLCNSGVVGPQTPASKSGEFQAYDQFVERNFPGSLAYIDSMVYSEWLFDRTSVYYKMFARTGDAKMFEAAYHAAHFVRLHTKMDGPDAGIFTLKGPDLKYVYPRAMHIHYLLTGDDRMREAGKIMARYCLEHQDPVYKPSDITPSAIGEDPEHGRKFWTLRHQGYGLLGILHGWELTGDMIYWVKARECVDAYYSHQRNPPDGRPPDGSLRQDWSLYDPNEANFKGATSAWMMALLLDPLFHYWTLTGDRRVPEIVTRWCDFLARRGMIPDGTKAYYVINCFAGLDPKEPPGALGPDMEMHNAEMAYTFALGTFFSKEPKQLEVYRKRFDKLFALAVKLDVNHPARAFNWTFQFSSQLIYFMQHKGGGVSG